ncbi:MAG: hypothetical protein Salg2KO_15120 [Salibacteraceae bacterium]
MKENQKLIVFSEKRSNRLRYVLEEYFAKHLNVEIELTQNVDDFLSAQGMKINYSTIPVENSMHIIPCSLLFQKRISAIELNIEVKDETPLLFANDKCPTGHDTFAACFYFLSLYQEYLPHRSDQHGRFTSKESLQSRLNVLDKAIVDLYAKRFAQCLSEVYPQYNYRLNKPENLVTIDIDQLFAYKAKGMARTALSFIRDFILKQEQFKKRLDVVMFQKKDPLDCYDEIIELCSKGNADPVFFLQVGETSRYDHNNPVHLPSVKQRINELALSASIGLHPSYFSSEDVAVLTKELERLQEVTSSAVNLSRQHYLRWRLPNTLGKLAELGITDEYSLAFADVNGFRAGTARGFRFFDLERDEPIDINVHPTHFSDIVAIRNNSDVAAATEEMQRIKTECDEYGGAFCTMWHPEALSGLNAPYPTLKMLKSLVL